MDLIFDPQNGKPFHLEVGFFDTVLEIKQKIEKYHGLPAAKQALTFNGQLLSDDRDVRHYDLLQDSRIAVVLQPEKPPPGAAAATAAKLALKIATAPAKTRLVSVGVDVDDAVRSLKDKIAAVEPVPPNRAVVVKWNGAELQDGRSLRECGVSDGSEMEVSFRPLTVTTNSNGNKGVIRLTVLTRCGTRRIPVEVSASDNVAELRKELDKLQPKLNFHLPPEGYFFIHKQDVMDDDRSFRWHRVANGDIIEIFNGTVTRAHS